MPLFYADGSIDPITLLTVPERFIIFYASIVDGEMWCPDCRRVEGLVKETFSDTGPDGLIVYVGTRTQWKTPDNVYRQPPWKISNIPTIIKLQDHHEIDRLGDDNEIIKNLVTFVQSETESERTSK